MVVFKEWPNPISWASLFFFIIPFFIVPTTTDPLPGIVNELSMAIRNGDVTSLAGVGIYSSISFNNLRIDGSPGIHF